MMFWYILTRIIISILVLLVLHYAYNYLKDTLTVKKRKDLVSLHNEKYKEILEELREAKFESEKDTTDDALFLETSLEKLIESI